MRKQSLAILSIIAVGSFFSTVYAASTIITDSSISTTNLTVTGTCTGCGGSEGSFTNYNTILFNNTLSLGLPDSSFYNLEISNGGNVTSGGITNNLFIINNGTVLFDHGGSVTSGGKTLSNSITGKYSIIINNDASPIITVFKNGHSLQNLGINMAQFSSPYGASAIAISISPDGHYISLIGKDSGGTDDRLIILAGT